MTKAEKIAKIPIEKIMTAKKEDIDKLRGYLRVLSSGYRRRVGSFRRKGLVSYAQISFEVSFPENIKGKPIKDLSRDQLILEIARYQHFFNSSTSSEKGIIKVNREQDKRIFGVDRRGRPLNTLSQEEREYFWNFYEEFKNQFPEWSTQPFSETVQQSLADSMINDPIFAKLNFMDKLKLARDKFLGQIQMQNLEDTPNVLSGRGANQQ